MANFFIGLIIIVIILSGFYCIGFGSATILSKFKYFKYLLHSYKMIIPNILLGIIILFTIGIFLMACVVLGKFFYYLGINFYNNISDIGSYLKSYLM